MEHLRVVVMDVAGIREAITGLGRQIFSLQDFTALSQPSADRQSARIAACIEARATLNAALDHPVHPPERHKEATL